MKLKTLTKLGMALGLGFLLAACNADDSSKSSGNAKDVNLAYVEWDTEIASTNVVGQVLEDLGYNVTLTPLDNAIMWEAVSKGEADGMVAAWLPNTHAPQYEKYKNDLDELGENLTGAKIGLVVPSYMDVNSIEDLKNQADQTITGIEPGAGITAATEKALDEYDNLAGWQLLTSSSGAMTTSLAKAIKNKEDIIVTGWSPHWKFAKYDLKYLDDPKGVYGGEETINTFARKGLKEDQPDVYSVLDNFHWTSEDLESVMLEIMDGKDPKQAAKDWVKANADKVAEWTKDVKK
ncbi:glycine betaine ABC transporter substrate-binding protein [Lysinibacillus sp. CNPSo 3705]|uniref:glycine betaine ABC transporter substrate-binding protein n=1 Tax=Lysinibacillus sp. CNPSo 3705 TaxID=3028148 RepID=UPI00104435E5|nr:glycine betaine ABC transporter substrate-binding protein [Lysinibacillus sp. CNPSo 3705]MDD1501952.1 glycine betaine ABC transporter substrate-binding protein [Lysinibacillus sp. CNPSo 3705]